MKKLISVLLVLAMVLAFAACGKEPAAAEETLPENATLAQILLFDFKGRLQSGASLEEIANGLLENDAIQFAGVTMPVEEGWLAGFSQEITGFTEGIMFSPMIGSIPFVGYLFRAESAEAAEALVKTLEDSADLRWNICTEADEMLCKAVDDTVFFVMAPTAMEG